MLFTLVFNLFVKNVQSNEHYQMLTGIPSDEMNTETERFTEPGTFCGEVGDLIIKVCSDILQVPIIVVTSINGSPYVPFIPDDALITNAIYVAYTAFGPGHYFFLLKKIQVTWLSPATRELVCLLPCKE